jgi:hypothetical protein
LAPMKAVLYLWARKIICLYIPYLRSDLVGAGCKKSTYTGFFKKIWTI